MKPIKLTCRRRSLLDAAGEVTRDPQRDPTVPRVVRDARAGLACNKLGGHERCASCRLPGEATARRHGPSLSAHRGDRSTADRTGEAEATQFAEPLAGLMFAAVFTSPLQRAVQTCELAGFGPVPKSSRDLVEMNYGTYEGRTSAEFAPSARLAGVPRWLPGGESPEQVGSRADRVIRRVRAIGRGCCSSRADTFSGVRRALARARTGAGRYFLLGTASLSALGTSMIDVRAGLSVSGTRGLTNGARTRVSAGA